MNDTSRLVIDSRRTRGELLSDPATSADRAVVQLESGSRAHIDPRRLQKRRGGGYHYEGTFAEDDMADDVVEEHRIPIAREEATVRRERQETGRVRIMKSVHEREETIDESVLEDTVSVERVPVDRVVEAPPSIREEDDVLIIPVVEERLVVRKELVLKEEVRIIRQKHQHPTTETVTLRSEEVHVEREEGGR